MLKMIRELVFKESDFDSDGNIKASSLMYEFQEIAAEHATKLGLGIDYMMANNVIWVMTKLRFKVNRKLRPGVTYILETYPRPRKGITFFRDYYIYSKESGNIEDLDAAGSSQWCVINFETRKIERRKVDFDGDFIDHEIFEDGIHKIHSENPALAGKHIVAETDMDVNNHMNNCRYADMIEDITGTRWYKDFTIHFSKEAVLGEEILLYTEPSDEEGVVVTGKLEDDTLLFQAKIK